MRTIYAILLSITIITVVLPLIAATTPSALATEEDRVTIPNPISCNDVKCLFYSIIRVILGILAVFATLVFVYGGFLMLTSGGNPELIKKARETLFWATMGIVTVLGSWIFIRFVAQSVITATK